jgi:alkaline phosphatase D
MKLLALLLLTLSLFVPRPVESAGPFQATGIKTGELTSTTAIVWTRLTRNEKRNPSDGPMVEIHVKGKRDRNNTGVTGLSYPDGLTVADIRNAVPGTTGQVQIRYRLAGTKIVWSSTDWAAVDPKRDFVKQFQLTGLTPNSRYDVEVASRKSADSPTGQTIKGGFRTAPAKHQSAKVVFTVSTGQAYRDIDHEDGYYIYPAMRKLDPNFFVHTGDIIYYDQFAKTEALARYHWQRTYSLPTNVDFHNNVSSYFIKDDHDTWQNDCWPSMKNKKMFQFTFTQGLALFHEQVPMSNPTYRTRRWGKDLQIWMVEGRDYRSPNNAPDGPGKTIWGKEQMTWFKKTVEESDATFRILISPTPVVGPDRNNKHDNHSNVEFTHEGDQLRAFLAKQKNMVVVCGDRHWQYMSVHPKTGVREYSCGPASDKHAGGWSQSDYRKDYHRYLNVIGGFLSGTVDHSSGKPALTFRYHNVQGKVRFEDQLAAE